MDRPRLRIAQIVAPLLPVPPLGYGGVELVVSTLIDELLRRGHDVTLFASGDSASPARLVPSVDWALWRTPRPPDPLPYLMKTVDLVFERAADFDVLHNHMSFAAFSLARMAPCPPILTTLHGRLDRQDQMDGLRHFSAMPLVSISDAQRRPVPWANWLATIYHGLKLEDYQFSPDPGAYAAFLGRVSPEKGLETAIEVARGAGMPLKIAARLPLDQPDNPEAQRDWRYWRKIEPMLTERGVEYVGELGGVEKSAFLGGARALIFPITWPEPFGLVMAEALACGTPVVTLDQGSAPEVIEDGVSGFVRHTPDEMTEALAHVGQLDRGRCRAEAVRRFSAEVMAEQYERLYYELAFAR